jgi:hypothetical protein
MKLAPRVPSILAVRQSLLFVAQTSAELRDSARTLGHRGAAASHADQSYHAGTDTALTRPPRLP